MPSDIRTFGKCMLTRYGWIG